jgi:hypothetical protein
MDSNYLVRYDGDVNTHVKAAVLTSSGKVTIFANDPVNNYQFITHDGTNWVSTPVALPEFSGNMQGGNTTKLDYWVLYSYSGTHFVVFRIETRGSFNVVVRYETLDAFITRGAGAVVSDADKNHEQLQGTYNLNSEKVIIAAYHRGDNSLNNMFLYEFTP